MNPYSIRRENAPLAVLALDEICFPHDHRVILDKATWWIVWKKNEAIGYAGLRLCENQCNKGMAFLNRVGIMPKHRGKGLQKRLIRARESYARVIGVKEVVTYCVPWNCASVNSLVSCGYKLYRPATKWGGAGAIYLRKRLF
jgi:predicted acetyltransferase